MTLKVVSLTVAPGIQRDSTILASSNYIDGRWVRFQYGRPRKILGYRASFLNATEVSRGMIMSATDGINYIYSGTQSGLQQWTTDNDDAVGSGPENVTITSGFTANANNLWQFDIGYDAYGNGKNNLIAHPGQNLNDITSTVKTRPLFGDFTGTTVSPIGVFTATGTLTTGSPTVTFASTIAAIGAGVSVSGTGIPSGTTVLNAESVSNVWTVTLSANATASGAKLLTFDNNISVSGGVVMLFPYLFVFGDNGLIQNCSAGDFNNWTSADANSNNISSTKVVKGLPLRGGTTSPAGLFWTLDSVVRVTYAPQNVGNATLYWRYDLITQQSSIMSSQCVIEYDGIFYWVGTDRFLMYSGVVQELPNNQNTNYFFDRINIKERQKVWVSKVPRWGEIWWFYPSGSSTECNDAIIFNLREKCWYDAGEALGARRSAGVFSEVFRRPIWAGWEQNVLTGYSLWTHEVGVNQQYLSRIEAIESYFETNILGSQGGLVNTQPIGDNVWTRCERIEPDFIQVQTMNVVVTGKGYAVDVDAPSDPYPFDPTTLKIDMREQRREMRLRFSSNVTNGDYFMGNVLLSLDTGDVRGTGNP